MAQNGWENGKIRHKSGLYGVFFEKTISKFEKTGMIVPFYIKTKGPVRNLDF